MEREKIAVIGLGAIFPKALNLTQYWSNILSGVDAIAEVPQNRWDWRLYWDPNPKAPDKTYSKIGGFVQGFQFNSLRYRIPPMIAAQMDSVQQLAVAAAEEAITDAGYASKLNPEKTAVILGNSLGGVKQNQSDLRVYASWMKERLEGRPSFAKLSSGDRACILEEFEREVKGNLTTITEDSMPGELSNVIAGRVANVFGLNGANFTVDAACASSLAAVDMAVKGLRTKEYDMVICGGADQMMAPPAFVKFSKIGALSADGSRPFDAGANGFVMGEGVGMFLLKRLSDAERDGDRIYALINAVGASSDGKGKGITAPNPTGQKLAVERAFKLSDYTPDAVELIEAHGTSTPVGDVVEANVLKEIFAPYAAQRQSVALGSVKSQIGHTKAAAGAASLVKTALSLYHKKLPPSINFKTPNPAIGFEQSPFFVNTTARDWQTKRELRRANVSSFGFGGTNFHVAMEEYVGGRSPRTADLVSSRSFAEANPGLVRRGGDNHPGDGADLPMPSMLLGKGRKENGLENSAKAALLLLGADSPSELAQRLESVRARLSTASTAHEIKHICRAAYSAVAGSKYRAAILEMDPKQLIQKVAMLKEWLAGDPSTSLRVDKPPMAWKMKGIHVGLRPAQAHKTAFLFPGQGSQYVDMMRDLWETFPVVRETFDEADRILEPLIGEKLSGVIFSAPGEDEAAKKRREDRLRQTSYTQPAVFTADIAIWRLLESFGVRPDMVAGHSLGEYAAMVAAGVLSFEDACHAISARSKEMANIHVADPGKMASVAMSAFKTEQMLEGISGYVAIANKNCLSQTVIAGSTPAINSILQKFSSLGVEAQEIAVSHAFHSEIVAPAQKPYRQVLNRLRIQMPQKLISSNVTADYYPQDPEAIRELLVAHIASPVEFTRQVQKMHADGARLFIECGPKRVLTSFVRNILEDKGDSAALHSNHPKRGGLLEFHDLLAQLYAKGLELRMPAAEEKVIHLGNGAAVNVIPAEAGIQNKEGVTNPLLREINLNPVVISGVAVGLPGAAGRLFDENNFEKIFEGENLIDSLSKEDRERQVSKNITRIAKQPDGAAAFEKVESADQVVKLAGQRGAFDPKAEFGIDHHTIESSDSTTLMALCAGLLALKDAGIPLVRHYRKSKTGTMLPKGWGLPEEIGKETGIIFASAFPGFESLIEDVSRFTAQAAPAKTSMESLLEMYAEASKYIGEGTQKAKWTSWFAEKLRQLKDEPEAVVPSAPETSLSRSFLLRVLPMGHAMAAQYLKAKGNSVHVNAACASTTAAIAIAEDWIRTSRVKRALVISADNVTSPTMREWFITGFLASGAASTEEEVENAALPFGKYRNGMVTGMGAAAFVLEDAREVEARGMRPLAELMATYYVNSALHPTRPDNEHIIGSMKEIMSKVESRYGLKAQDIAAKTIFYSHETYTHPVGGISTIEVEGMKQVFGPAFSQLTIANTKGFTGHPMAVGIEDAVAVRGLQLGKVPPIANFKEADPQFSGAKFSRGGTSGADYALRFAAGFGSQLALSFVRRVIQVGEGRIQNETVYQSWLDKISNSPNAQLEVVQNVLRVVDSAKPAVSLPVTPAKAGVQAQPVPAEKKTWIPASAGMTEEDIKKKVLDIIVAKTGYPTEMLELDLDMEADLGIDSVKQAEIFGVVREAFSIPRVEGLSIKSYPTLRHMLGFVAEQSGAAQAVMPAVEVIPPPVTPAKAGVQVQSEPQKIWIPASAGMTNEELKQKVLDIIVAKTGYPAEMLELDLDMEADLGIDSVKQAEIFGIVRETFNISKVEGLSIKDYPTLRHMLQFVEEKTGASTSESLSLPTQTPHPTPLPASGARDLDAPLFSVPEPIIPKTDPSVFKRYVVVYPASPLQGERMPLTPKGVVLLTPDTLGASNAFKSEFAKRGFKTALLPLDSWLWQDPAALEKAVQAIQSKEGPIQGIVHTMALDLSFVLDFQKISAKSWQSIWVKSAHSLFAIAKAAAADLFSMGSDGFVVSVSHSNHPLYGAVRGMSKSLEKEIPSSRVRSVSFDALMTSSMAKTVWEELQYPKASGESSYKNSRRYTMAFKQQEPSAHHAVRWNKDSVFLITGGGQGVAAELAKELARRYQPHIVILGRTALPPEAAQGASMTAQELNNLKLKIWEEASLREGRKITPVELEKEFSKIRKSIDLYRNLEVMRNAGAKVHYLACDVAKWDDCERAVAFIREKVSPVVHAVIHAAGLEVSKTLADKTHEGFKEVFSVKADGAFHLAKIFSSQTVQRWVFFSSVVAKFGNLGQTDYSAANDFLNALASDMSRWGQRAISIGLTAWDEIGMATRGGVKTVLEQAGVDFMPPAIGVEMILKELERSSSDSEVILTGRLGVLDPMKLLEGSSPVTPAQAGVQALTEPVEKKTWSAAAETEKKNENRFIDKVLQQEAGSSIVTSKEFSLQSDPYLKDHQIGGVPYVPGVMGLESFAQAIWTMLKERVSVIKDVRFQLPVKLLRNKSIHVRVRAEKNGDAVLLRMESDFISPQGFKLGDPRQHFSAAASISSEEPAGFAEIPSGLDSEEAASKKAIYEKYFHGPSFQVLSKIARMSPEEVWAVYETPEEPLWPFDSAQGRPDLITMPMLVEAAFQAAGYRDMHFERTMTLPDSIGKLEVYSHGEISSPLWVHARFLSKDSDGKSRYDVLVIDKLGRVWVRLKDYRMIPVGAI